MKIYITASFRNWENNDEINTLCAAVRDAWFEDYCFVRDEKNYTDPYEMMNLARQRVLECDCILMNYDWPTHGRMIEIWIAYAMQKKVIIITQKWTNIKDTVIWVSDIIIEYENINEITKPLQNLSKNIIDIKE